MKYVAQILLSALFFAFIVGCSGDPTANFKSFVAEATASVKADEELANDYEFRTFEFDVEKTDSTISPYTAQVLISAIYKPASTTKPPARDDVYGRITYDDGKRNYLFNYAYQEGRWILKDFKSDGNSLLAKSSMPDKLIEYFTK